MFLSQIIRKWGLFCVLVGMGMGAQATDISGAGATFPSAVYVIWADSYNISHDTAVRYSAVGSSHGIEQIKAKMVDFGATDIPLPGNELTQAGLVQFPAVMGGVTIVFNLPGIKSDQLKLTGTVAADIFRGAIIKWNDPAIASQNKHLKLPDMDITIVHRAENSGTTYVVTNYLAKQSNKFKKSVGVGRMVNWPTNGLGEKTNQDVAVTVQRVSGSIGYVDYADALQNNLSFASIKNKSGRFVSPSKETIAAAAMHADFFHAIGMAPDLLDQDGENSWPIVTATYILVYGKVSDVERINGVLKFFNWALRNGQIIAKNLGFVALPNDVVKQINTTWEQDIKDETGKAVWM